jgi:predicted O-methyltransferase YrrM
MNSELPQSPAADRNKEPILAQLRSILGERGTALEIASGTGQHVIWFAASLPAWTWQPTDADEAMLPVIRERVARSGLANVLPPLELDVRTPQWLPLPQAYDAIFCANMLHIAPWEACPALMACASRHLAPQGLLITYGPYFETDVPPAPGNVAFDQSLRSRDPAWGIRALPDVVAEARRHGFALMQRHTMPANNLLLVFRRPEPVAA